MSITPDDWFDRFFDKPITQLDMWHSSNITRPEYTEALGYSSTEQNLADFTDWLNKLISTDDFINRSNKYVDIYRRLNTETDKEMRHYLVRQASQLKQGS